jgi:hypothetical protein
LIIYFIIFDTIKIEQCVCCLSYIYIQLKRGLKRLSIAPFTLVVVAEGSAQNVYDAVRVTGLSDAVWQKGRVSRPHQSNFSTRVVIMGEPLTVDL